MVLIFELNIGTISCHVTQYVQCCTEFEYYLWVVTLHQWSANFFIAAQITFLIAIEAHHI